MQVETFNFKRNTGWSINPFPKLDSPNTLILAFCAPEYIDNQTPLEELKKFYPQSKFAGCSSSGEIYNNMIDDHSISVAVAKFDKTQIKVSTANIEDAADSYIVGKQLADDLNSDNLNYVLILSDGLKVNGSTLVEGLKNNLSSNVVITGGLAGDGNDFKNTWVIQNEIPKTASITAIGFYGNHIVVGFGCKGGWDIFGPERLITHSDKNILYEIDGQPALALYKKYLGDRASELPASGLLFPLAISENPGNNKQVVRSILAVDENNQSITFAGEIPQGWYAQLMTANFDRLIEGASIAAQMAKTTTESPQSCLGIAISCVGRRLVLGERSDEEIEITSDVLGKNTSLIGFYSYGEISPSGLETCDLHNQTMTLTTISEN